MRPGAQVFLHIPDKNKLDRISKLCEKSGYSCRRIQNADVNRTILELISGQSAGKKVSAPPLYFLPEMMIFQGLADKEVHQFLEAYRAEGIPAVDLKAVVTPWNLTWTLYELAEHLKEEHRSMH
ncbi:MAG: DUF3783 domain-containing protein [Stomatobaculum sp.]|nr:DUF3783 domain-containing protein [Stomatobaculum sp.]